MDKNKLLITAAVLIVLIVGLVLGYILGIAQVQPIVKKSAEKLILPESKVILNWTAALHGEVTKISDRTLTLVNEGEELAIPIAEDAFIISFILPETPTDPGEEVVPEQKEIKFEEIKVGDTVDVFTELTPERTMRGINVIVIPR